MSETDKEKKSKLIPLLFLLAFVALAFGMFFSNMDTQQKQMDAIIDGDLEEPAEVTESEEENTESSQEDRNVDPSEFAAQETTALPIDLASALEERILGNPDAPIKISEHSSFSCGHCGKFHQDVMAEFKANWLDTGKAYLVFSDFPLNAPALHASLATRCIADESQYFAAVEEVFAKQQEWAYTSDYLTPLKAILGKYGIDSQTFDACMNNQDLQTGVLNKVRAAQQQFGVNSTPSFVINNAVTIAGGADYEEFNTALEAAIEQLNNPTSPEAPPQPEAGTESP